MPSYFVREAYAIPVDAEDLRYEGLIPLDGIGLNGVGEEWPVLLLKLL